MTDITVTKLTGWTGADISGLDLSRPISIETGARLVRALDDHGVIFLPPHAVSENLLVDLAAVFGTVAAPAVPGGDAAREEVRQFVNQPVEWHADTTWMARPPGEQIFQVIELPDSGGDTLWASTEAAYATLAPRIQVLLEGLTAIHDDARIHAGYAGTSDGPSRYNFAEHPVVRVHPRSGRRSLFVNPLYTSRIVGLSSIESRHLLNLLYAHIERPEHFVRRKWQAGGIAVWDNRSTVHYAVGDYGRANRRVHRVSTLGEQPLSTGDPSTAGDPDDHSATPALFTVRTKASS